MVESSVDTEVESTIGLKEPGRNWINHHASVRLAVLLRSVQATDDTSLRTVSNNHLISPLHDCQTHGLSNPSLDRRRVEAHRLARPAFRFLHAGVH
jgi:hypothetical protein